MRLLSICLGREMLNEASPVWKRQQRYYAGWSVDFVCLSTGSASERLQENLKVLVPGGQHKAIAWYRAWRVANQLAKTHCYEAITSEDLQWTGLIGWLLARTFSLPWQAQDHSGLFSRTPFSFLERIFRPLSGWLAKRATRLRTVSERGKRGCLAFGISSEKIDVIPVSTDLPELKQAPILIKEEVRTVLSVGRLEKEKGYDVLLRAWSLANLSQKELVIVGDGSQRTQLEALARHLGLAGSVVFTGWLSGERLQQQWRQADVYVQPSWFEGWGRALLEAASIGLPIVSTDVGLIGEVLRPNQEVMVCGTGDVIALSACLKNLVSHWEARQLFAQAARQRVQLRTEAEEAIPQRMRESLERCRL